MGRTNPPSQEGGREREREKKRARNEMLQIKKNTRELRNGIITIGGFRIYLAF